MHVTTASVESFQVKLNSMLLAFHNQRSLQSSFATVVFDLRTYCDTPNCGLASLYLWCFGSNAWGKVGRYQLKKPFKGSETETRTCWEEQNEGVITNCKDFFYKANRKNWGSDQICEVLLAASRASSRVWYPHHSLHQSPTRWHLHIPDGKDAAVQIRRFFSLRCIYGRKYGILDQQSGPLRQRIWCA